MKIVNLLIPVAVFLTSSASALTQDEKDAKDICDRHRASAFATYTLTSSIPVSPTSYYDSGFSSCDRIMEEINRKEAVEKDEKNKADAEKLNKFAASIGIKQCK